MLELSATGIPHSVWGEAISVIVVRKINRQNLPLCSCMDSNTRVNAGPGLARGNLLHS